MSIKRFRGDTIIEVAFAIAVFSLVAIISINVMNAGLSTAQASMEVMVARSEIDSQAEALRFVQNAFTLERELPVDSQEYRELWYTLTRDSNASSDSGMMNSPEALPSLNVDSCSQIYDRSGSSPNSIFKSDLTAFAIDTRALDPNDPSFMPGATMSKKISEIIVSTKTESNRNKFTESSIYPRLIYTDMYATPDNNSDTTLYENGEYRFLSRIEGIWVIAVKDATVNNPTRYTTPEFFDFHIRTCWNAPGQNRPSTIGTIIRLYNPELVEDIK